jgi:hypothetical protein
VVRTLTHRARTIPNSDTAKEDEMKHISEAL